MVLSEKTISDLKILEPCFKRYIKNGVSGGLSYAGYDIALDQTLYIVPGSFVLGSSVEKFDMPKNVVGFQHDKSTWARRGIAVQATVVEPGWKGYLTIEISNHGLEAILIEAGTPIAQITFHLLDQDSGGYQGKYQNQGRGPQKAIYEEPSISGTADDERTNCQSQLFVADLGDVTIFPHTKRSAADCTPPSSESECNRIRNN